MTLDRVLTFSEFRLDPASGHLYRGDTAVPLTPKAFSLLHHLAQHAGRLVSKAELMTAIWPDVFVGDAVLKSSIRELRRALGDDSHHPRYIETAHRRGYRFIAPIVVSEPLRATGHPLPCQLRAQRQREHRLRGDRRRPGGPRLRHGLGVASRVLLERAVVRAVPAPAFGDGAPDPLRQARHRPVRPGVGDGTADARAADGRRAGGDGGGGIGPCRAAGCFGRRTALFALRRHSPGPHRGADHGWQLRAPHEGARLSLGRDPGGARRLLPDDPGRMGRAGRHRRARAVARVRRRRFASGGRPTSGWGPAQAPRWRSRA